jgi:uncharacterized protein (TIGR00730 family)
MTPTQATPKGLVAVLAGSLAGALPAYQEAATRLGALLAGQGLVLLLPGPSGGLLRAVAAGASARGGQIIEVVVRGAPTPWTPSDHVQRFEPADLHPRYEVADFSQRQALLLDQADAVIALPGGPATIWDLLGEVTLAHLALHSKPVGILNVADWFTPLLALLRQMQQTGFVPIDLAERSLIVDPDPLRLLMRLLSHPHWLRADPMFPGLDASREQQGRAGWPDGIEVTTKQRFFE